MKLLICLMSFLFVSPVFGGVSPGLYQGDLQLLRKGVLLEDEYTVCRVEIKKTSEGLRLLSMIRNDKPCDVMNPKCERHRFQKGFGDFLLVMSEGNIFHIVDTKDYELYNEKVIYQNNFIDAQGAFYQKTGTNRGANYRADFIVDGGEDEIPDYYRVIQESNDGLTIFEERCLNLFRTE